LIVMEKDMVSSPMFNRMDNRTLSQRLLAAARSRQPDTSHMDSPRTSQQRWWARDARTCD
jgi:hypothetical protein